MKTKIKFALVALCVMLLSNLNLKAQLTLTNNLNCDVTIAYEMWKGPICTVCGSNSSYVIPGNSAVTIGTCAGYDSECITVIDIGGFAQSGNHTNGNASCHVVAPSASGNVPAPCSSTTVWTTTHSFGNWIINP